MWISICINATQILVKVSVQTRFQSNLGSGPIFFSCINNNYRIRLFYINVSLIYFIVVTWNEDESF